MKKNNVKSTHGLNLHKMKIIDSHYLFYNPLEKLAFENTAGFVCFIENTIEKKKKNSWSLFISTPRIVKFFCLILNSIQLFSDTKSG